MKRGIEGLIEHFISSSSPGIGLANEIEAALDDAYPEDDFIQDTVLMLASYRPGGGD